MIKRMLAKIEIYYQLIGGMTGGTLIDDKWPAGAAADAHDILFMHDVTSLFAAATRICAFLDITWLQALTTGQIYGSAIR